MGKFNAQRRISQAFDRADHDGYERDDGKWIDPIEVQQTAIEIGFERAANDPGFDIWTVVNPRSTLEADDPLIKNLERVFQRWDGTVDRPEMKQRLIDMKAEFEQGGGQ